LQNGRALQRLRALVVAQGGDPAYVDDPERLPRAVHVREVASPQSGYLQQIDAREIGIAAVNLGAGRSKKGERIDHTVGVVVHHKVGDQVGAGEPLFAVHAADPARLEQAAAQVTAAHRWSDEPVERLPLFYKTLGP
jgi:pyrimidine-nucleoside phosphorylase